MSDGDVKGYITIRVPVVEDSDPGTMEEGPTTWLAYGEAELISHDLNDKNLAWVGHEISYGDITCNFEWPHKALIELADEAEKRLEKAVGYPKNLFEIGLAP